MRYSNTTLKELTTRYKHVLMKCAYLNVAIIAGAMIATPAFAAPTVITTGVSNNIETNPDKAGGLTIDHTDQIQIADNVTYSTNTATGSGGAIKALDGFTAGNGLNITGNHSDAIGGGMYIRLADHAAGETAPLTLDVKIGNNAVFSGNSSKFLGGGLAIESAKTVTIGDGAEFTSNSSLTDGGGLAVYTDGVNKIGTVPVTTGTIVNLGQTTFTSNTAANRGGAIANLNNDTTKTSYNNTINVGSDSKFISNSVTGTNSFGGAIYNIEGGTINLGNDVTFDSNTAANQGGAIYNRGTINIGDNVLFKDNTAAAGGAIVNVSVAGSLASLTIGNNAQFIGNKATDATGGAAGVLYNQNGMTTIGANALFKDNTATFSGGALYNETTAGFTNSTLTVGDGAQFINNTSGSGGAIYQYAAGTVNTVLNIGRNSKFDQNKAVTDNGLPGNGGAISLFDGVANIGAGTTFTNNTAAGVGGAIKMGTNATLESATLNLNTVAGNDISFSGNTDGSGANDIYMSNTSILNINGNGTVKFGGGISTDGDASTINVNNTSIMDIGASKISAATINFAQGASLKADLLSGTAALDSANINAVGGLGLVMDNNAAGGKLTLTQDNDLSFKNNAFYDIVKGMNGEVTVTQKSAAAVTDNLLAGGANATEAATISAMTGAKPTNAQATAIANAITTAAQTGDTAGAAALADAVNPTTTPVVQAQAIGTTTQIMSVLDNRMSAAGKGRSGGSMADFAYGPWIQGLYNKTHNSQGVGFDGYTQGFALGADVDVTDTIMVGAGYGYTATDINSNGRKTNVYGDNYFIYGKYQPSEWYTSGTLNYGHGNYHEKSLGLTSKYNVDTYAAEALVGYQTGIFDNYAGVRYIYVNPDSNYSNGLTEVKTKDTQVGTAIIGTKISKDYTCRGIIWKPEFRIAGTYDVKSDNSSSVVNIVGGNSSYSVSGGRLHRAALESGVGLTATVKNLDVILGYDTEWRSEQFSQTGSVKLQYNF